MLICSAACELHFSAVCRVNAPLVWHKVTGASRGAYRQSGETEMPGMVVEW